MLELMRELVLDASVLVEGFERRRLSRAQVFNDDCSTPPVHGARAVTREHLEGPVAGAGHEPCRNQVVILRKIYSDIDEVCMPA